MSVIIEVVNPHISRITLCEVEVEVAGKKLLLRPTLRGVLTISRAGGFERVMRGLLNEDVDSLVVVLLAGLCWKEKKRNKIENWVFRHGLKDSDLINNLLEFLENMQRGGKLPADSRATAPEKDSSSDLELLTLEQWADNLYLHGTGWLGWSSKQVLNTTLGALQLAIDGKLDCIKRTNPFGSGEDEKEKHENEMLNQKPNPELAANMIQDFFKRRIAQQQRDKRNKSK